MLPKTCLNLTMKLTARGLSGTFAGMIGKLDYLQQLGVNAIELLPIHEFNELEYLQVDPYATAGIRSTCGS